jgi:hypothetical protein
MMWRRMKISHVAVALAIVGAATVSPARAQDPPPRIGPLALDLHATVPRFPSANEPLADSRGLPVTELPGTGLGGQLGLHLYFVKFRAITFGIGGEVVASRAKHTPPEDSTQPIGVTETFRSLGSQLSLNFGTGTGWSYLSGGIGRSNWAIYRDGAATTAADDEVLKTINYGGGARWFAKSHLAFSFDVRFYALNPGSGIPALPDGTPARPGSPRTTFLTIGAGISLKP